MIVQNNLISYTNVLLVLAPYSNKISLIRRTKHQGDFTS